jgi:hypothetical protein
MDINPYQGEIDSLKLNHWLQQLEVYLTFTIQMKRKKFHLLD